MSLIIEGTYKNGAVSLDRLPDGVTEARVIVDFIDHPKRARGGLKFGLYAKLRSPFTTDEALLSVKKSWNRQEAE